MTLDSRSDELDKKLEDNDIDKGIDALSKGVQRQKRAIILLILAFALDFILTMALAVLAFKTNELAQLAQNNKEAIIQNCETANESRTRDAALWNYIFSITPDKPMTDTEAKKNEIFHIFIKIIFGKRQQFKD